MKMKKEKEGGRKKCNGVYEKKPSEKKYLKVRMGVEESSRAEKEGTKERGRNLELIDGREKDFLFVRGSRGCS